MVNSVCSQNLQSTYLYYDSIHFLFEKKKLVQKWSKTKVSLHNEFPKVFPKAFPYQNISDQLDDELSLFTKFAKHILILWFNPLFVWKKKNWSRNGAKPKCLHNEFPKVFPYQNISDQLDGELSLFTKFAKHILILWFNPLFVWKKKTGSEMEQNQSESSQWISQSIPKAFPYQNISDQLDDELSLFTKFAKHILILWFNPLFVCKKKNWSRNGAKPKCLHNEFPKVFPYQNISDQLDGELSLFTKFAKHILILWFNPLFVWKKKLVQKWSKTKVSLHNEFPKVFPKAFPYQNISDQLDDELSLFTKFAKHILILWFNPLFVWKKKNWSRNGAKPKCLHNEFPKVFPYQNISDQLDGELSLFTKFAKHILILWFNPLFVWKKKTGSEMEQNQSESSQWISQSISQSISLSKYFWPARWWTQSVHKICKAHTYTMIQSTFCLQKKKTGPEMEQNQSVSTMNFPKYFLIKIFLTS